MKYRLKVGDESYDVELDEVELDVFHVRVGGHEFRVELEEGEHQAPRSVPTRGGSPSSAETPKTASSSPQVAFPEADSGPGKAGPGGAKSITAPMPGKILRVMVSEGQQIESGDVVVVLEAMKMENELRAKADGTVRQVAAREGQNVAKGDLIVDVG